MPELPDIPISSFPDAESISNADKVTGIKNNLNTNFTFSTILSWFVNAVRTAFVPVNRTVNGKPLDTNVTLTASDVGARPDTWTPSAFDVGAIPAAEKGVPLGVPVLDIDGKVPSTQLPPIPSQPSDIGALPVDGTAVAAGMLSTEWYVSGNAGWYKFLEIDMAEAVEQLDVSSTTLNLTLFISENRGDSLGRFYSGILQIRFNVNSNLNFVGGQIVQWGDFCANGVGSIPYTPNNIKYITDNTTKKASLYINKVSDNTGRITVSVLRRYARSSSVVIESGWRKNEAVAEVPSDALDARGPIAEYDTHGVSLDSRFQDIESAVLAKSRLVRFTAQVVSVASGAEIFRITDAEITTDTEVVSVEFANPSYITAGGSWTSYAGYVAFTGTCTAATTADIILKI